MFARNAAMAFNRLVDANIDRKNPRTCRREIPQNILSRGQVFAFVFANSFLFCLCAWWINPLCFGLSFVALFVILAYSYTKRFTSLCHFVLGLGLSFVPVGAYLSLQPTFEWHVIVLGGSVFFLGERL